jgi:hypothetical protein
MDVDAPTAVPTGLPLSKASIVPVPVLDAEVRTAV